MTSIRDLRNELADVEERLEAYTSPTVMERARVIADKPMPQPNSCRCPEWDEEKYLKFRESQLKKAIEFAENGERIDGLGKLSSPMRGL